MHIYKPQSQGNTLPHKKAMHIYKPQSQGNTLPHKRAMHIYKPPSQGNTLPHKKAMHIYKPQSQGNTLPPYKRYMSHKPGPRQCRHMQMLSPHYHKATDNNYIHNYTNMIYKILNCTRSRKCFQYIHTHNIHTCTHTHIIFS